MSRSSCRFPVVFLSPCYIHTQPPNPQFALYPRLIAVRFPKCVGEPLQTLVQTVTGGGAGGLDELEGVEVSTRWRCGGWDDQK